MSLRAYKKSELKEMCQKLKLSEEGLKNDLEDRLQNFLDQSSKALEDIPELKDHFSDPLPVSPSTARKAARKSIAMLTGDDSDFEAKAHEVSKSLNRRLESAAHDIEVSPSKVAQWANDTKAQWFSKSGLPKVVGKTIPKAVGSARSQLSQVSTVAAISIIVEGAKMTKALVPINYEVKLGGLRSLTLPDILVFLSVNSYWKPILTWLSFQLIPLFLATVFNFRASAGSKKGRKVHAVDHAYDPVTFAITKLLMVYLAFHTSVGSELAWKELSLVEYIVGNETFMIGTAISLIYAFYEAAL